MSREAENWHTDVHHKPDVYAAAGIPLYVVGDRRQDQVVVHSDPHDGRCRTRSEYKAGHTFTLPSPRGGDVEFEADSFLLR
ncbi:hypothetical protein E4198_10635 [Streptomyces sp. RKND-216]|uniref:Uma2 family endonuclease n=1 Tax=Streptomyces sp. RKND-216 TaxID=2562581 RepID=UPI00109D9F13|nr:Uma2 family endonuclease [Streptomyces sp. RKND-216]THA25123.1 hypothetical protein E4198_10635 [Streptomyces sp. RKND-216]